VCACIADRSEYTSTQVRTPFHCTYLSVFSPVTGRLEFTVTFHRDKPQKGPQLAKRTPTEDSLTGVSTDEITACTYASAAAQSQSDGSLSSITQPTSHQPLQITNGEIDNIVASAALSAPESISEKKTGSQPSPLKPSMKNADTNQQLMQNFSSSFDSLNGFKGKILLLCEKKEVLVAPCAAGTRTRNP